MEEPNGPDAPTLEVEDAASEADPSHAHARAILTVEQRVGHIMALMENLTFQRGNTCRALAREWGLALSTVEGNAAEASRRVLGDKEEAVRDITVGARLLLRSALLARDAKSFHLVGSLWADVTGARKRVDERLGDAIAAREVSIRIIGVGDDDPG
jgi:hypothetical protein